MIKKAIEVKDLKKSYGNLQAVAGISFYAEEGQVFTLLGPNGAGKTTTIEILEGLKKKDSGRLYFFGQEREQIGRVEKEEIGVLLQKNNFIEKIKVKETLQMFASFYQKAKSPEEILNKIVLEDKADAYVEELSGGQQQRLSIGLALLNDPRIIFLDEPTTGLDPQARRNVWDLIEDLKAEGKTIFLTTHYMDEAEQLSDYVYIMDQGQIIASGSPSELIDEVGQENVIVFGRNSLGDEVEELQQKFADTLITEETVSIYVADLAAALPELFAWSESNGQKLDNLQIRRPNLEDVFLDLTGKGLRE